jgi:predicted RNA-binding Zn-ribbon protein involved in translation (DUF1610 family)
VTPAYTFPTRYHCAKCGLAVSDQPTLLRHFELSHNNVVVVESPCPECGFETYLMRDGEGQWRSCANYSCRWARPVVIAEVVR